MRPRSSLSALVSLAFVLTCNADEPRGCLGTSDPACVPPSPCGALTYACASTSVRAFRVERPEQRPAGIDALASRGDYVIENDFVSAVIEDVNHTHHLATSGGNLLDLVPRGGTDHLNAVYAVTGILPRDGIHYRSINLIQEPNLVAVIARGDLEGDARVTVTTRYELRPCDRGVRVRTEVYNGGRSLSTWFLSDAIFWGDRGMTAFTPREGGGFRFPKFDLLKIDTSWITFPWMAAQSHNAPDTSYAFVSCTRPTLEGLQDSTISAYGLPRTIIGPGDGAVFERVILAASGSGLAGAQALALEAHTKLFGGSVAHVTGRLVGPDGMRVGGGERQASLLIYEPSPARPDDPLAGTPWNEVVPGDDGTFRFDVPAGKTYRAQVHRLGRAIATTASFTPQASATHDLGMVRVARAGQLTVRVTDAETMAPIDAEVVLTPVNASDIASAEGSIYGLFPGCAPYLGPPDGNSPACNRALVPRGETTFAVPPGTYWVYATAGPSSTLARERVTLTDGMSATTALSLRRLTTVFPRDAVSADLHVHGGRSFDAAIADRDRVMSFVTAGVDVIISTDHDVVNNYEAAVRELNMGDRVTVVTGVESTPLVPYLYPPGSEFPKTIGHMIFWPLTFDANESNNGMPWDELQQPGQYFDVMRRRVGANGVLQLNHPTAESKAARDEGYFRVLEYHQGQRIPLTDDGTALGMIWRRPGGASAHRNIDYDVQEALNGVHVPLNLTYRELWHNLLSHGILRAGTANSDSHSLRTEQLGYPRNIVHTGFDRARFDLNEFNRAVREGRLVGTNGPYIEARTTDAMGATRGPGVASFAPANGAMLDVEVRAAPWVPVTEVRFIVNGQVARTISGGDIMTPTDAFGTDGVVRWRGQVNVRELLGNRDGWIIVEAGVALPPARDSDDDGLIDLVDGDGDGALDDTEMHRPADGHPRFHVHVVSPGILPLAYTNPFVVDVDGNGWRAPRS
jgi:hypothetical protein